MKMLLLLLLALVAGCGEKIISPPVPGQVILLPPIEWRVVDRAGLLKAYADSGMTLTKEQDLKGFIGVTPRGKTVIYSMAPATLDDSATLTLGHEVLHVAIGDFHR